MNMLGSCEASESLFSRLTQVVYRRQTRSAELFRASRTFFGHMSFKADMEGDSYHRLYFTLFSPPHIKCPQEAWTLSQEESRCRCVGARRQRVASDCWPAPRVTLTGDRRRRVSSLPGSAILGPTLKEASEPRSGATTSPETRTWTRFALFCLRWNSVSNALLLDVNNIVSGSSPLFTLFTLLYDRSFTF